MDINWFQMFYSVLGGLGIFFFGMKGMSDGLQAIAGDAIKNIINKVTSNRILAVLVGTAVTMLVQSSSVTTVMVIGFVNAGLMNLVQAIGVIFGANIGTTITGWIISINIGKYGLLMVGLGIIPMLFSKKERIKELGQILFSIGFIFFGLEIMSNSFKPLRTHEGFIEMMTLFSSPTYFSYLSCIFIGCLLTMVIQSSSAMLGITMALATTGVIEFQTALSLVLGENIGTTITALLASVGATTNAKRAARAHALFNICGVLVVFALFPFYIEFIEWFVPGNADFIAESGAKPYIAVHIATGHSLFNVFATILFLPFINVIARIVTFITPEKEEKEKHHLVALGNPQDMIPATALVQVSKEMEKFFDIINRMFIEARIALKENAKAPIEKLTKYEHITDNIQKEISNFMCKLLVRPLSETESLKAQSLLYMSGELETLADHLERMCYAKQKFSSVIPLEGEAFTQVENLFNVVEEYFFKVKRSFSLGRFDFNELHKKSNEIKVSANYLKNSQTNLIQLFNNSPDALVFYSDIIDSLRKVRGHTHNLVKIAERK